MLAEKEHMPCCPECFSNEHVIRFGFERNGLQAYYCKYCSRRFNERTSADAMLRRLENALLFVSAGISVERMAEIFDVPAKSIWCAISQLGDLSRIVPRRPNLSGVLVADETKIKVRGIQRHLWVFMDLGTRFIVHSDVTAGRGEKDALRGIATYASLVRLHILVTDAHPSYSRAMRRLFLPRLTTVFWNRKPGKRYPFDTRFSVVTIDDHGGFVVVSLGRDRLLPLGIYRCMTEEDLAEIIMRFSGEGVTIIVNTHAGMSAVIRHILSAEPRYTYHFICGYGYLKAFVECVFVEFNRRLGWFHENFGRLDRARSFVRAFAVYYNWFRRHGGVSGRPGELMAGCSVPRDVAAFVCWLYSVGVFSSWPLYYNIYLWAVFYYVASCAVVTAAPIEQCKVEAYQGGPTCGRYLA